MCSVLGAVSIRGKNKKEVAKEAKLLLYRCRDRGRDSSGIGFLVNGVYGEEKSIDQFNISFPDEFDVLIGNTRAEPTTEYVENKTVRDTHPFTSPEYSIVHNGVVSNDKEIRQNLNIQTVSPIDSTVIPFVFSKYGIKEGFNSILKGSFAVLCIDKLDPHAILGYRDYKPLFMRKTQDGIFFASKAEYFSSSEGLIDIPPYSFVRANIYGNIDIEKQKRSSTNNSAFVICSGGLDSTTSAAFAKYIWGYNVTLVHFTYGCQAETREMQAVRDIASKLDCKYQFVDLSFLKQLGGNALVDSSISITDSITGAEYAHEWVPFRNGVMIALTAALCDRYGVESIFLGLNLEEGGAFPDNTEEFYQQFNKVLAIGSTSRPTIMNPLGNLMKHEIVKLALEIGAPIESSWSCYRGGDLHCGRCAPCFMRRKAFEMNKIQDIIKYESEV